MEFDQEAYLRWLAEQEGRVPQRAAPVEEAAPRIPERPPEPVSEPMPNLPPYWYY